MGIWVFIKKWWLPALFSAVLITLAFFIWDSQRKLDVLEKELQPGTEQTK